MWKKIAIVVVTVLLEEALKPTNNDKCSRW